MSMSLETLIELIDTSADVISKVGLFKRYFEEWYRAMTERPQAAWMFSNVVSYSDKHPEWPQTVGKDLATVNALLDTIAPDRPGRPTTFVVPACKPQ